MLLRLALLGICFVVLAALHKPVAGKPNVLFIFVDDLRPELGCYGSPQVQSPNIDRIAAQAIVFKQQFVTVPTCGASRASLLTGRLPRTTAELGNEAMESIRATSKEAVPESFIHQLRLEGYYTVGMGKISHSPDGYIYGYRQPRGNKLELPKSWDEMLFDAGRWGTGWNAFFGYADGTNRNASGNRVMPYEKADVADEAYPDGLTAALAVKKLKELSASKKPFFLGVGFFKPHLPFNAPAKYWDLYEEKQIELAPFPGLPLAMHPAGLHESEELNRGYKLGAENPSLAKPVSDDYARRLKHAYFAGVSYIDAQIGKVLDALKKTGLDKNTILVLWGDHGWHLGEHRVWGKHTLSDWALRSPLLIHTPGMRKGMVCNKVVSAVDLYPTLMALCGIKTSHRLDGKSLLPLFKDPDRRDWQEAAYSYFRRGITMRTKDYRLTRYFRTETPVLELYDYRSGPVEWQNIAVQQPAQVNRLLPLLQKGNTGLFDPPAP